VSQLTTTVVVSSESHIVGITLITGMEAVACDTLLGDGPGKWSGEATRKKFITPEANMHAWAMWDTFWCGSNP
jgi:hypothetical protein